jgi:very-short-patch-repair endonuclease
MPRLQREPTYRARSLRRAATPAERALWALLRDRALDDVKFRRQHPLGRFIVDFFCVEAAIVVEADGAPHFPRPARDIARDRWLKLIGCTVLRFPNRLILESPNVVLDRIRHHLANSPLPSGEGPGVRATGAPLECIRHHPANSPLPSEQGPGVRATGAPLERKR